VCYLNSIWPRSVQATWLRRQEAPHACRSLRHCNFATDVLAFEVLVWIGADNLYIDVDDALEVSEQTGIRRNYSAAVSAEAPWRPPSIIAMWNRSGPVLSATKQSVGHA